MYRWILALAVAACCFVQRPLPAAVISRDWKTPGDGLLTYDDVNQREWLDLTESRIASFPGTTFQQRIENAVAELQPGGKFESFKQAKTLDLRAFSSSAGIDIDSLDFAKNQSPTTILIDLVGASVRNVGLVQSYGFLDEPAMIGSLPNVGMLSVDPDTATTGRAGLYFGIPGDLATSANTGLWLYRVVPEPQSGTCLSILVALELLMCRALTKRQRCKSSAN
jgi:hypothetical protein